MRDRAIKVIFLTVLIFFAISCKEEKLVKTDFEARDKFFKLESTGWKSRETPQKIDNIIFKSTEVPLAYYIIKSIGNENVLDADSICKANNRERIFEFEVSEEIGKDLLEKSYTNMDYSESIEYMSFKIQKDFYVVTSTDTIPCSASLFERNFKITPHHKLLLFFNDIDPQDQIQLIYDDHLFGKGTVKFTFKENITKLIL